MKRKLRKNALCYNKSAFSNFALCITLLSLLFVDTNNCRKDEEHVRLLRSHDKETML